MSSRLTLLPNFFGEGVPMALPEAVMNFLKERARQEGVEVLQPNDDLFALGVLDSFALVDFISVIETESGISVPDSDVLPNNFKTIDVIARYLESHQP
jgi:acyl carrier protein